VHFLYFIIEITDKFQKMLKDAAYAVRLAHLKSVKVFAA